MASSEDLMGLKEIGSMPKSDFESSSGSGIEIEGEAANAVQNTVKEKIVDRIDKKVKTTIKNLIETVDSTPSRLRIYELNCGLQIILPISNEYKTVTALSTVVHNPALDDYTDWKTHEVLGAAWPKWFSRWRLKRLLKKKDFMPLLVEDLDLKTINLGAITLGDYSIDLDSDETRLEVDATRTIEDPDSSVKFEYVVSANIGENPKVQSFQIGYTLVPDLDFPEKFSNATLYLEYDKELALYRKRGEIKDEHVREGHHKPSYFEIDYGSSIENIVKLALQPENTIKENFRKYVEELEQFKPVSFR